MMINSSFDPGTGDRTQPHHRHHGHHQHLNGNHQQATTSPFAPPLSSLQPSGFSKPFYLYKFYDSAEQRMDDYKIFPTPYYNITQVIPNIGPTIATTHDDNSIHLASTRNSYPSLSTYPSPYSPGYKTAPHFNSASNHTHYISPQQHDFSAPINNTSLPPLLSPPRLRYSLPGSISRSSNLDNLLNTVPRSSLDTLSHPQHQHHHQNYRHNRPQHSLTSLSSYSDSSFDEYDDIDESDKKNDLAFPTSASAAATPKNSTSKSKRTTSYNKRQKARSDNSIRRSRDKSNHEEDADEDYDEEEDDNDAEDESDTDSIDANIEQEISPSSMSDRIRFRCNFPKCKYQGTFLSKDYLRRHIREQHRRSKSHTCDGIVKRGQDAGMTWGCGKKFNRPYQLVNHWKGQRSLKRCGVPKEELVRYGIL